VATLEYDFRIVGMDAVAKGFASLERRAKAHNDAMQRMFGGARAGGAAARGAGGAQARGPQVDPQARNRSRAIADQEREQQRQNRREIRAQEQHQRQLARQQQQAAREEQRVRDRAFRQEQRANEVKLREERKAAAMREREREREWNRISARHRKEEREGVRAVQQEQAQMVARRRRRVGMVAGAVGQTVSDIGGRALDLAKLGAGGIIAMGLNAGRSAYRESTALAAQSKQAGNTASMRDIHKDILETSRKVTESTGVDRASVIKSMSAFHGIAGSLEAAKGLAPYMASAAEATAAEPGDIARLAGVAFMRAKSKGMSDKAAQQATQDMIGIFASHAAKGTIEMSDYAAVAPEILAAASQMMSPQGFVQTAAITSAIAQGSIGGGATTAAEAATATARLVDDLTQNYEKIKKVTQKSEFGGKTIETMALDPETGVRKLKGFEETIPQLLAAAQGDVSRLMAMGIDVRGNRAMKGFLDTYIEGTKRTGPGTAEEKGAGAVREAIINASKGGVSAADFAEMAKAREELDPYAKVEKALVQLADTAIPPLTEAMQALAETLKKPETQELVGTVGKGVKFAAENPLAAFGIYAGGKALFNLGGAYLQSALGIGGGAAAGAAATEAAVTGGAATAGAGGLAGLLGTAASGIAAGGAAAIGALGAVTAGSVGAAVYNAVKLREEMNTPFMTDADLGVAPVSAPPTGAAGRTPGTPAGGAAGAAAGPINEAAGMLKEAAVALKASAAASVNLNRSDSPGAPSPTSGGR